MCESLEFAPKTDVRDLFLPVCDILGLEPVSPMLDVKPLVRSIVPTSLPVLFDLDAVHLAWWRGGDDVPISISPVLCMVLCGTSPE